MIKCKACGEVHSSAIQVDQMRFQTVTLTNNSEDCPKCHAMSTYNKEDYFFQWMNQQLVLQYVEHVFMDTLMTWSVNTVMGMDYVHIGVEEIAMLAVVKNS